MTCPACRKLNQMRPFEAGSYFGRLPEVNPVVIEALKRFMHYVSRHKYIVAQWEVATFWWASAAVEGKASVSNLRQWIDADTARYESELYHWDIHHKSIKNAPHGDVLVPEHIKDLYEKEKRTEKELEMLKVWGLVPSTPYDVFDDEEE